MTRMIFANSLSFYSNLIDHCLCILSANSVHAQLIKVGLNTHTFLGNRILHLYSTCGNLSDSLRVFQDISSKNSHTWNIFLKGYLKFGFLEDASFLFCNMPGKDIVSWNMMISGYATYGYIKSALGTFIHMQEAGVRPSEFTFSILLSFMSCSFYGKQIHCYMLRYRIYLSNVVLGNSLIGMYGKLGLTDCALSVFLAMEDRDVITWNTLIWAYYKSQNVELALSQFHLMRNAGYSPDSFTMSTVIAVCSELSDIGKSGQICALCFKMGSFSNMIVSSAAIDMFSKCHLLKDSLRLFQEIDRWNPAVCNSMISCYASHGFWEDAFRLFVLSWRSNVKPSEFTVSSLLSSVSVLFAVDIGSQIHSVAVKLGLMLDDIVASSLMEMYSKYGCIDSMQRIFRDMSKRDLISWNTMILGLARSGRVVETLDTFKELLDKGPPPDRITLAGVLVACSYGGLVYKGREIFFSMEEDYGVIPRDEHYACIIDLLSQAGKVGEALDVIKAMPHEANTSIWKSILYSCEVHGNLILTEMVAEKLMELEPTSSLPYLMLFRIYEMRGELGSMVRVLKVMKERSVKKVTGCSSMGIKNHVVAFYENELLNSEFKEIYLLLRLLTREVEDFSDVHEHFHILDALEPLSKKKVLFMNCIVPEKEVERHGILLRRERYNISTHCRLHPDKDLFRDQEQHKIHFDVNKWRCGYCKKSFWAEKYLDQHFDNRHYNLLNASNSKCLADLCGALHCDTILSSKPPMTKCNPAAAARNRHLCESLATSCFPINQGASASRLHELFSRQFCDAHTCSGRHKPFPQGGRKRTSIFYLAISILTLMLLPIFYVVVYLHRREKGNGTQELKRISRLGQKKKPF